MSSKLEYLQRYMSGGGGDAIDGEKKKKKKVKKTKKAKSTALGTRVVDADDTWEQSAPNREAIEKKWEMDAAEDEQPLVVAADGEELVDPQDLPVYVDSDKYLDEFKSGKTHLKKNEDEDMSPPRKRTAGRSKTDVSVPRDDASPPRRGSNSDKKSSRRQREESDDELSPLRRQRREKRSGSEEGRGDASPPRRSKHQELGQDDDASPPRRHRGGDDSDAFPLRRKPYDGHHKAVSSRHERDKDSDALPPRNDVKKEVECLGERKPSVANEEDTSPPRRSRRDDNASPSRSSRQDSSDLKRSKRHLPPAARDRQRRVDSLGRDVPPRSSGSKRRDRSASRDIETSSKRRDRRSARSRSRSHDKGRRRDRDRASPRGRRARRNRSRSPRSRGRDSRSPSEHRRRSPRRSSRRSSPHRKKSLRPRSRGRHHSTSPRSSRSRSSSPRHHTSRRRRTDTKKEGAPEDCEAHNESRTAVQSPSPADVKTKFREPKKKSDDKEEKKAGLFTAAEFEHQRKVAARRKDILRGVDASEMGANAETVYRDKRGRKLDMLNEMVRQQEVLDGKRKREEREEYEWGTGEVQKRERKSQHELLEQMKKTPFARHEDDEELDRKRRERVRAFDPMNSKVFQEDPLAEGKTKTKKSKKDKKSKKKPRYAGPPAPPNRFGIQPGYRWDGVVRGTNWEEKIMMRQNANAAVSEEAYKYAVADM
ncbi:Pre-mRNA-splicing factor of RES complex [Phytophthora infestans]|nr:Pre-mRNA-splicing factor of RES complex [Phytophthora infestans]